MRLLGYQPRAELPVMLTACDVAVLPLVRGVAGISVPSRFYNILAAGKPVIVTADAHAEPAMIVRDENIGWVVLPGDTERLALAIEEARRHPEEMLAKGRRARRGRNEVLIRPDYDRLWRRSGTTKATRSTWEAPSKSASKISYR